MLDYPALEAVSAIVREGSFERAAAALGITPSAVSQRVRGLEERLGAVLVVRGQPCRATDLGAQLCAHIDKVRLLEADLAPSPVTADAEPPLVPLRIAVNADSLATWFPQAAAVVADEPGLLLELMLDDEAHTADRLKSGEVIAAVTASREPVQGCRMIPLGIMPYVACASPDFVARHFPEGVVDAASLPRAPHLRFDRRDELQRRWALAAHGVDPGNRTHWISTTQGFLDMSMRGLGWAMHPAVLADPLIAAGQLVELPPRHRLDVHLSWMVARLHAGPLMRLTEAVRTAARQAMLPVEG